MVHRLLILIVYSVMGLAAALGAPQTMRVDYFHTGNQTEELFSVDRIVIEPMEWPGDLSQSLDETNLGKYLFEVRERASNRMLYSRGFSSIYGEWETTEEAKTANRAFHESLRFPLPNSPVQVIVKKRDARNSFREIWSVRINPDDMFIDRSTPLSSAKLIEIEENGEPAGKVDVLILGDGYTASELGKFENDARRLVDQLFATEPFKARRKDFNVWALCPAAAESGVSRPSSGIYRASPLGTSYDIFGSERYLLTYNNRAFREVAQFAPYEFVEIITNTRTYGGGGIFNLYGTVAAQSAQAPYIFVHEFGHHFADLADEYYTSPVAYALPSITVEPWEPNVTALLDGKKIKWGDLVDDETEIPTPWRKEEFDANSRDYQKRREKLRTENRSEDEMEKLFADLRDFEQRHFAAEKHAGKVGAFEGAMYQTRGYYRPELNCIMFTRSPNFCRVCQRGINRIIDLYTQKKMDGSP